MPRFEHICVVRAGHELPAKMRVLRMVRCGEGKWRSKFVGERKSGSVVGSTSR